MKRTLLALAVVGFSPLAHAETAYLTSCQPAIEGGGAMAQKVYVGTYQTNSGQIAHFVSRSPGMGLPAPYCPATIEI
jgi:hypothetical protein